MSSVRAARRSSMIILLFTLGLLAFQNCNPVRFSQSSNSNLQGPQVTLGQAFISINNGDPYTNTQDVMLSLAAPGAKEMYVTDAAGCESEGQWEPMAASRRWALSASNTVVSVYAKYRNGSESTPCVHASILHDNIAPKISFLRTPDKFTALTIAPFEIQLDEPDLSGLDHYECALDNGAFTVCESIFMLSNLSEDNHRLLARGIDKAGNVSAAIEYDWQVDLTPPAVAITKSPNNPSLTATNEFEFIVEDNPNGSGIDNVYCQWDMMAPIAGCKSPERQSLPDGDHVFRVWAEDHAGNTASASYHWSVHTTPSEHFNVLGVTGGQDTKVDEFLYSTLSPTVHWETSAGAIRYRVSVLTMDETGLACPERETIHTVYPYVDCALVDGASYKIKVIAFNHFGLARAASRLFVFTVDNSGPVISIQEPVISEDQKKTSIEYTVTDHVSGVETVICMRSFNGNDQVIADCQPSGQVNFNDLLPGSHTFTIIAKDQVGNESTANRSFLIKQVVCNPFDAVPNAPCKNGLKGSLYYQASDWTYDTNYFENRRGWTTVRDYIAKGVKANVVLFFSQLFVPRRTFSAGFPTNDGNLVRDNGGQPLFEWFAMQLDSVIKLGSNDTAGKYELAVISDDGAIIYMKDSATADYRIYLNNDGLTAPRMGCSATKEFLTLDANSRIPLRLEYYQGPRQWIAITILYRKIPATGAGDAYCGVTDSNFFGTTPGAVSTTGTKYGDLLNRGWKPLTPDHFVTD